MRHVSRTMVMILVALAALGVQATDRYVAQNGQTPASPYTSLPSAASNIQEAVDAALAGDTVWVGAGRYTVPPGAANWNAEGTNVVKIYRGGNPWTGLPLTLRSISGNPADTIIDGEGKYRGIWMGSDDPPNYPFIVDGFTITNGYAPVRSGGIYMYHGNVVKTAQVVNCVITDNKTIDPGDYRAGGISVGGPGQYGGNLAFTLTNCVIRNSRGNGLSQLSYASSAGQYIQGCRFENNDGAGLFLAGTGNAQTKTTIRDCQITGNHNTNAWGGKGGGLWIGYAPVELVNCLIANNSCVDIASPAYVGGGAMYVDGATSTLYNCTIVSNFDASGGAGGIYESWHAGTGLKLYNTIIYFNRDELYGAYDLSIAGGGMTFTNCLSPGLTGPGNISVPAPEFLDAATGDFRLKPYSSGVDAGITQAWMTAAMDLNGQPRVSGNGLVDMGAYETSYEAHPGYYAAHNGQVPAYPYTNWTMAASNIQEAVTAFVTNYATTLWVGPGTYTLPPTPTIFAGTNIVYINKPMILRSSSGNPADTIIDGQGLNRGIAIVYGTAGAEFVVDGLTITNCHAVTTGGGIFAYDPAGGYNQPGWTLRVRNCVIVSNLVSYGPSIDVAQGVGAFGGGIGAFTRSTSALILSNCVVNGNVATNAFQYASNIGGNGGGIYHTTWGGTARVDRCRIQDNWAYRGGNALLSMALVENSVVSGGRVEGGSQSFGGGFGVSAPSTFRNCLMYDNNTGPNGRGSAIWVESQGSNYAVTVENCTLAGNLSGGYAIFIRDWAKLQTFMPSLHLVNSIVYSNSADLYLRASDLIPDNYSSYASNCCLSSTNSSGIIFLTTNMLYYKGLSANTFTTNPRLVSVPGANFRLSSGSPCINAGMNLGWMAGTLDLDGNLRISPKQGGTVDMGAYEFPIQSGSMFSVR